MDAVAAFAEAAAETFCGQLKKHEGLLALQRIWIEYCQRYVLYNLMTSETRLVDTAGIGKDHALKFQNSGPYDGYAYIVCEGASVWVQSRLELACFQSPTRAWVLNQTTGEKVWQDDWFNRNKCYKCPLVYDTPERLAELRIWIFKHSNHGVLHVWWSIPSIIKCLGFLKKTGGLGGYVNKKIQNSGIREIVEHAWRLQREEKFAGAGGRHGTKRFESLS